MQTLYYLDTNALLKYSYYQDALFIHGKQEKGVAVVRSLIENKTDIFYCSNFALLECYHTLLKNYRDNQKCKLFGETFAEQERTIKLIFKKLRKAVEQSDLHLETTPLSAKLLVEAQKITYKYGMQRKKVDSMDAVHLALVKYLSEKQEQIVVIITSDKGMQTICEQEAIAFFDPEQQE